MTEPNKTVITCEFCDAELLLDNVVVDNWHCERCFDLKEGLQHVPFLALARILVTLGLGDLITGRSGIMNLVRVIGEWKNNTFGKSYSGGLSSVHHMREEVNELRDAVEEHNIATADKVGPLSVREKEKADAHCVLAEEAADVFILLAGLVHTNEVNLFDAVEAKHEVNLSRTWGEPDAHGVRHHLEEGE